VRIKSLFCAISLQLACTPPSNALIVALNPALGIMDPTANPAGQINIPSALDLRAFDAIGWQLIPEPSSALFCLVLRSWWDACPGPPPLKHEAHSI
jgi:hypothetical protein